jgi:hypothetical protein
LRQFAAGDANHQDRSGLLWRIAHVTNAFRSSLETPQAVSRVQLSGNQMAMPEARVDAVMMDPRAKGGALGGVGERPRGNAAQREEDVEFPSFLRKQ